MMEKRRHFGGVGEGRENMNRSENEHGLGQLGQTNRQQPCTDERPTKKLEGSLKLWVSGASPGSAGGDEDCGKD